MLNLRTAPAYGATAGVGTIEGKTTMASKWDPAVIDSRPSDGNTTAFPEPDEITDHAVAFAGMMFAHAGLEREMNALQHAISKTPQIGQQRANQWAPRLRPFRMVKWIETYRGSDFPHTKEIETLLKEAIDPCEQRDYLVHGLWWCFNSLASSVVVCATTSEEESTQREYTADDIYNLAKQFKRLESEIHKVRRLIEVPVADAQILARIDAELEKLLRLVPAQDGPKDHRRD
jgi:hypothetical protein